MSIVKTKCAKCKGSGKVPFSVANGICFDCDGKGYTTETKEATEKREIDSKDKWNEYIKTNEYKAAQLNNKYDELIGSIQHAKNASEWESNFAYDIRGKERNRLSNKQKAAILKLSLKLLANEEHNDLKNLLQ